MNEERKKRLRELSQKRISQILAHMDSINEDIQIYVGFIRNKKKFFKQCSEDLKEQLEELEQLNE